MKTRSRTHTLDVQDIDLCNHIFYQTQSLQQQTMHACFQSCLMSSPSQCPFAGISVGVVGTKGRLESNVAILENPNVTKADKS